MDTETPKGPKRKECLLGQRFGRLIVIEERPRRPKSPNSVWLVRCDCAAPDFESYGHNLKSSKTQSCGCLKRERLAETADKRIAAVKAYWAKYRARKIEENPPE